MRNKLCGSLAVLALAAGLAGCSGSSSGGEAAGTTPSPDLSSVLDGVDVPTSITGDARDRLVDALSGVDPDLVADDTDVANAVLSTQMVCASIQSGTSSASNAAAVFGYGGATLTDDDGQQLIDLLTDSEWCPA